MMLLLLPLMPLLCPQHSCQNLSGLLLPKIKASRHMQHIPSREGTSQHVQHMNTQQI
jgi:hypothetical protein